MTTETAPQSTSRNIRWRVPAFYAALVLLAIAGLVQRLPGLDPFSLWLDDLWLAVLTKHASSRFLLTGSSPCPPAFGLLIRWFTAIAGYGEWQFQMFPLVAGLAYVVLAGHFAFSVTRRMSVGLMAAAFAVANPALAIFSLRVKPYTLDALITQALLMAALASWQRRTARSLAGLTALAALGMVLSFPSLLVSAALINAIVLCTLLEKNSVRAWGPPLTTAAACNAALLVTFLLFIRPHFSGHWSGLLANYYASPTLAFMRGKGAALFWGAFPARLTWIALFVPAGLYALMREKKWRGVGLALLIFYPGLFLASMIRLYPIGAGRTDIFTYPLTIAAAVFGIDLLTRKYRFFAVGGAVFALAVFGFELATIRYTYPESGARAVVEHAGRTVTPDDGLVIYPSSNWPVALYGRWPTRLVVLEEPDTGFYMYPERPRTLVINEVIDGVWRPSVKRQLEPFLANGHERIAYVASSVVSHVNAVIVECITAHGYEAQAKQEYPSSCLTVFVRRRPGAVPDVPHGPSTGQAIRNTSGDSHQEVDR